MNPGGYVQPAQPAPPTGMEGDHGFPPNTPLEQMQPAQREAYWRYHSRKHEATIKGLGNVQELQSKAAEYDRLRQTSQSENERAVAEARRQGELAGRTAMAGQAVDAYVRAAAAAMQVPDQAVNGLLTYLERGAFIGADGQVDAAKVSDLVRSIAPAGQYPGQQYPGQQYQAPMMTPPPAPPLLNGPPAYQQNPQQQPGYQQPGQQPGYGQQQYAQPGYGQPQQVPGYPAQQYPNGVPQQPGMGAPNPFYAQNPAGQGAAPATPGAPGLPWAPRMPDFGQGSTAAPPMNGLEAGKALALARFGAPQPPRQLPASQ